jgi:hypothetical protein
VIILNFEYLCRLTILGGRLITKGKYRSKKTKQKGTCFSHVYRKQKADTILLVRTIQYGMIFFISFYSLSDPKNFIMINRITYKQIIISFVFIKLESRSICHIREKISFLVR